MPSSATSIRWIGAFTEHPEAQRASIQPAIGLQHFRTEPFDDSREGRLARFDGLARGDIGIEQRQAMRNQSLAQRRLARGDATTQRDNEGSLLHCSPTAPM